MYEATIGLEVHVQLDTQSKLFCRCPVGDNAAPNTAICPTCLAHPGTLPVTNRAAIVQGVRAALALGGTVHATSVFARKHYFYPDLPKGYQISQFDRPICTGGAVFIASEAGLRAIPLTRLHLEEDAGKSIHDARGTLVDYNRAGVPLAEIVSEPALHSAAEAEAFLRALHRALVAAGVTRGDLEKGHLRCDANISLAKPGARLGTRVEIKNLNSFRFVARAIEDEIARQTAILDGGGAVEPETRSWKTDRSERLRGKEEAADYRYFPDPDLPPLGVDAVLLGEALSALPAEYAGTALDAPAPANLTALLQQRDTARLAAFAGRYALDPVTARVLLTHERVRALYEATVAAGAPARDAASWCSGEVLRKLGEGSDLEHAALTPDALAALIGLVADGTVQRAGARAVLDALWEHGGAPLDHVARLGLGALRDDDALRAAVRDTLARSPEHVARYREGNTRLLGYFMGQVMKATGGRADPALATALVVEELDRVR